MATQPSSSQTSSPIQSRERLSPKTSNADIRRRLLQQLPTRIQPASKVRNESRNITCRKLTDEYSIINNTHEYYAYLNWDRIREMSLSGTIEIQNHTYDLHHADGAASIKRRSGESDEAYTERIQSDFLLFQTRMNEIAGITPTAMVYPYGTYNQTSEKIARELGFKATMTCREGINYITRDPECLFRLKRQLRAPGKSIESFL